MLDVISIIIIIIIYAEATKNKHWEFWHSSLTSFSSPRGGSNSSKCNRKADITKK